MKIFNLFFFFFVLILAITPSGSHAQPNQNLDYKLRYVLQEDSLKLDSLIELHNKLDNLPKSKVWESYLELLEHESQRSLPLTIVFLDSLSQSLLDEQKYCKHTLVERKYLDAVKRIHGTYPNNDLYRLNSNAINNRDIGNLLLSDQQFAELLDILRERWGEENEGVVDVGVNRCRGLNQLGNYKRVIEICENLIVVVKNLGIENTESHAGALYALGEAYLYKGDFEKGSEIFSHCKEMIEVQKFERDERYLNTLAAIAECQDELGNQSGAENYYKQAVEGIEKFSGKDNSDYINALNNLAEFYIKHNRLYQAKPIVLEAYEILKTIESPMSSYRYVSMFNLIKLKSKIEVEVDVIPEIEGSLKIFNKLMNQLRPSMTESQENLFLKQKIPNVRQVVAISCMFDNLTEINLKNIYTTHVLTKGIDRAISSFSINRNNLNDSQNIEVLEWERIKYQINNAFHQNKNDELDSLNLLLDEIEKKLLLKEEKVFEQEDIEDIQSGLNKNEVVLDFFSAIHSEDSTIYGVFILRNQIIEAKKLFVLSNENKVLNEENQAQLASIIVNSTANFEKVHVIPSGFFHRFPFMSLKYNGQYIFENKKLIILNTSLDVLSNRNRDNEITKDSILLVGGLYYNESDTIFQKNLSKKRTSNEMFSYLPFTRKEVEEIKELVRENEIPYSLLTEFSAKKSRIKKRLGSNHFGIAHFSTHGYFDSKVDSLFEDTRALFHSGLALSADPTPSMKVLTAYDVSSYNMEDCKLVVLSACNTGIGQIGSGDNVYGLQKAFQTAGVENILLTLSEIDDMATAIFMKEFYSTLVDGVSVYESYTHAIDYMKLNYDVDTWSSFKLVGKGDIVIFPKKNYFYYFIFLGILCSIIAFSFLRKLKT